MADGEMNTIRSRALRRKRNNTAWAAVLGVGLLAWPTAGQSQGGPFGVFDIFKGSAPAQAGPPQTAPGAGAAARGAVQPWTGEDGASGHPLMTAQAIREAANNFSQCVAGLWPDAARRGISEDSFRRFTEGLTPDLRIMDLMDSQPEFTKALWDYLDILVNDTRMAKGREVLTQYKTIFDAAEKTFAQPDWEAQVFAATNLEKVFLTNEFDDPLEGFDTSRYDPIEEAPEE